MKTARIVCFMVTVFLFAGAAVFAAPATKVMPNDNGSNIINGGEQKTWPIKEGDVLEVAFGKAGVVLKPKVLIDKESILSTKGEKKVKEALDAYKKGETKSFKNAEDLIEELNS